MAYVLKILCKIFEHRWSKHALGRYCKNCGITKKEYILDITNKIINKDCVVCTNYHYCYEQYMRNNSYMFPYSDDEEIITLEKCMRNNIKYFNVKERYKKYDRTSDNSGDGFFIHS